MVVGFWPETESHSEALCNNPLPRVVAPTVEKTKWSPERERVHVQLVPTRATLQDKIYKKKKVHSSHPRIYKVISPKCSTNYENTKLWK